MGRRTGFAVALVALVVLAAAVAGSSLGSSDRTKAASGTVVLSGWGASPDELKLLKAVIRGFEKTFPKIKVDYQPITGDYVPAMLAKFTARKPPDVFYVDSNVFLDWVTQGLLEPLDSYAQKSKFSSKPFYPVAPERLQVQGQDLRLPEGLVAARDGGQHRARVEGRREAGADQDVGRPRRGREEAAAGHGLGCEADLPQPELGPRARVRVRERGQLPESVEDEVDDQLAGGEGRADYYVGLIKQGLADIPAKLGVDWCGAALGKQKAAIIFEGNWLFPFMQSTYPDVKFCHAADDHEQGSTATSPSRSRTRWRRTRRTSTRRGS